MSVPLPNVAHNYLKFSFFDLDVPIFRSARFGIGLTAHLDYLYALSAGDIERRDTTGYGPAQTQGLDVGGGFYLQFRHAFVRVLGGYRRFAMAFDGASCYSSGSCNAAGGALDVSSRFTILGGFAY